MATKKKIAPKKTQKRKRKPSTKQLLFNRGKAQGLSDKDAGRQAGYKPSTLRNIKNNIWDRKGVSDQWAGILDEVASPGDLKEVFRGLVKKAKKNAGIAFSLIELARKIQGLDGKSVGIKSDDDGLTVNIDF